MNRAHAVATVTLAFALVAATAAPATSDDEVVTWDQVRVTLAAARGHAPAPSGLPGTRPHGPVPGGPQPPAGLPATGGASATITVSVTIPDLSWALDDPTADPQVRRAACHQATGLDDETAAPLAACLAHIAGDEPGGPGHHNGPDGPGHHGNGNHGDGHHGNGSPAGGSGAGHHQGGQHTPHAPSHGHPRAC